MFMPFRTDKDQSLGSVFIEYATVLEARKTLANANNYRLDKKHTFKIYMYEDVQKLLGYQRHTRRCLKVSIKNVTTCTNG